MATSDFDRRTTRRGASTASTVAPAPEVTTPMLGMKILSRRPGHEENTGIYNDINDNINTTNENNNSSENNDFTTSNKKEVSFKGLNEIIHPHWQEEYYQNYDNDNNDNDSNNSEKDYAHYIRTTSLLQLCKKFAAENDLSNKSYDELMTIERPLWSDIRNWFHLHNSQTKRLKAVIETDKGNNQAVIHILLREFRTVPMHIMRLIIDSIPTIAPEQVDGYGWTPLHCAARYQVSLKLINLLQSHYPQGLVTTDKQGRTPLHHVLSSKFFDHHPDIKDGIEFVNLFLDDEGQAVRTEDKNGMLPMHYACAHGAPVKVIDTLKDAYPESLVKPQNKGRTPLHLVMANTQNKRAPEILHYMIQDEDCVTTVGVADEDGRLPLHLFSSATSRHSVPQDAQKTAKRCLIQYLNVPNAPQADYFSALRTLPNWLQATAFAHPGVLLKDVLNDNTAKPVPTMILLLDFYMLIALIITFQLAAEDTIACMYQGAEPSSSTQSTNLAIMFITAIYFTLREAFQVYSVINVGIFYQAWVMDLSNLIDLCCINLTYFWFVIMLRDHYQMIREDQRDIYRSGMALTTGIYWLNFLLYLRATSVDFAVFVGGVIYVLKSLAAFLISLLIVLVAFAQMFFLVSQGSNRCLCNDSNLDNMNEFIQSQCIIENDDGSTSSIVDETSQNFCSSYQESLLTVYYMMVGQVETEDVTFSIFSTALFCVFMFLAVILLTNMLIAIVTESYVFVKDYNSSEVFWSNRFAFLVEVDPINRLYSQIRNRDKQTVVNETEGKEEQPMEELSLKPSTSADDTYHEDDENHSNHDSQNTDGLQIDPGHRQQVQDEAPSIFNNDMDISSSPSEHTKSNEGCMVLSEKWKAKQWASLSSIFEQDTWDDCFGVSENISLILRAMFIGIFMIIWICLGIATAGLLWPNQVRKYLLEQRIGQSDFASFNDGNEDSIHNKEQILDSSISSSSSMTHSFRRQSSLFITHPAHSNKQNNNFTSRKQDVSELNKKVDDIQNQMLTSEQNLSTLTSEVSELKFILLRLEQSISTTNSYSS